MLEARYGLGLVMGLTDNKNLQSTSVRVDMVAHGSPIWFESDVT